MQSLSIVPEAGEMTTLRLPHIERDDPMLRRGIDRGQSYTADLVLNHRIGCAVSVIMCVDKNPASSCRRRHVRTIHNTITAVQADCCERSVAIKQVAVVVFLSVMGNISVRRACCTRSGNVESSTGNLRSRVAG